MKTFKCPNCDFDFEDYESYSQYISYWGEEGDENCECPECGHEFLVKEVVTRTWKVKELPTAAEEVPDGSEE